MKRTCPTCKKEVERVYPRSITIGKRIIYFHDDCYIGFLNRIEELWKVLTGPQEDFDRFLGEE